MSNKVIIYTDGACRGNGKDNATGAYGIVLMDTVGNKKEIKRAFKNTTNNIMELSAVVDALSMLKQPCTVDLYSDSAYVINAINQKWLDNWQRNGWRTSGKEPVKNKEIWERLIALLRIHKVNFIKVKGHSDNEYNNRCDALANEAMDELLKGGV